MFAVLDPVPVGREPSLVAPGHRRGRNWPGQLTEPEKGLPRDYKNQKPCLFPIKVGLRDWCAGMATAHVQFYYENKFIKGRDVCPFASCLEPCLSHGRHTIKIC